LSRRSSQRRLCPAPALAESRFVVRERRRHVSSVTTRRAHPGQGFNTGSGVGSHEAGEPEGAAKLEDSRQQQSRQTRSECINSTGASAKDFRNDGSDLQEEIMEEKKCEACRARRGGRDSRGCRDGAFGIFEGAITCIFKGDEFHLLAKSTPRQKKISHAYVGRRHTGARHRQATDPRQFLGA